MVTVVCLLSMTKEEGARAIQRTQAFGPQRANRAESKCANGEEAVTSFVIAK